MCMLIAEECVASGGNFFEEIELSDAEGSEL